MNKLDADIPDRLEDAPVLDFLHVDRVSGTAQITFIPPDDLSAEPKLVARVRFDSVEGRQVAERLDDLARILHIDVAIERISHRGGGDFTFHSVDGAWFELSDSHSDHVTLSRAHAGLECLARVAESAYRIEQMA